jgi:hypothetical protein
MSPGLEKTIELWGFLYLTLPCQHICLTCRQCATKLIILNPTNTPPQTPLGYPRSASRHLFTPCRMFLGPLRMFFTP